MEHGVLHLRFLYRTLWDGLSNIDS